MSEILEQVAGAYHEAGHAIVAATRSILIGCVCREGEGLCVFKPTASAWDRAMIGLAGARAAWLAENGSLRHTSGVVLSDSDRDLLGAHADNSLLKDQVDTLLIERDAWLQEVAAALFVSGELTRLEVEHLYRPSRPILQRRQQARPAPRSVRPASPATQQGSIEQGLPRVLRGRLREGAA